MLLTIVKKLFKFLKYQKNDKNTEMSCVVISALFVTISKCFNTAVERHYIVEWLEWSMLISAVVFLITCFILMNNKNNK